MNEKSKVVGQLLLSPTTRFASVGYTVGIESSSRKARQNRLFTAVGSMPFNNWEK